VEFLDLTKLWKRAWIILLALVIGGIAALVLAWVQPTLYLARARMLVGPGISNAQPDLNVLRASGQLIQTYAELPLTEPFLQNVIDELRLNISPSRLASLINVRPNPETQILTIEVLYDTPQQAQQIAALIATKLIQISPSNPESAAAQLKGQVSSHLQELEQSISETRAAVRRLQEDYQRAIGQQLLGSEIYVVNQANANQLSEYERNTDLIASADTQSAAGVNILNQLIENTNTRIAQFEQLLTPDLNPITRKLVSDQIQAERVHLSNLQQAIAEVNRPIEGQPLSDYIQSNLQQQQDLEQSLSDSLSFDFRRLQFDRITLTQQQLKQARAIESERQSLILARIASERDRLYQIEQLDLNNQQSLLNQLTLEQDRLSELQNTLSVLYTSLENAEPNNVELLELASPTPQKAPLSLMVMVGAMAFATLTAVGVLAVEYVNTSIESTDQITSIIPVPVLDIKKNTSLLSNLLNGKQLRTERSQKYQMIGMRLLYSQHDSSSKLVLVGPVDSQGDSGVVAGQLAIFLARAGKRVILVDANPEQHTIANLFRLGNRSGLSDFLATPVTRNTPIIPVDRLPNLGLLPYGNHTQFDTSFLATSQMLGLIERLSNRADLIVMASPALQRSDALILASHALGVVMVVTRGHTQQKTLQETVASLNLVGARVLAAVLKQAHLPGEQVELGDRTKIPLSNAPYTPNDMNDSTETTERVPMQNPGGKP
jgi:capsular polysaccharide biosynthesis protein/MinD-like ATPase involved in chromosome partitioning or flagellar assembly